MRIAVHGETCAERLALRGRLAPLPAFESLGGLALSGLHVAAARLGVVEALARRPATADDLAARLRLRPETTRLLLAGLHALGYLRRRPGGRYAPTRRARRWLLPQAPQSVAHFVASQQDHFRWWASLTDVARGAAPAAGHHDAPVDDPYWRGYITGQYELARFSAPEVVAALRVPEGARRVLDVGGGHGWFTAALCRRHPGLRGVVLDLPGSVAVGRELMAEAGMSDVVAHRVGDARTADLGDGYDVALCLNLIHHFPPDEAADLFRRLHAALRPGGTLAVLDLFADPPGGGVPGRFRLRGRRPGMAASCLGLLFHLSSGASVYGTGEVSSWLTAAGFPPPSSRPMRRIPAQTLLQTTKPA
jgi:SAM-dependent methyltransferase